MARLLTALLAILLLADAAFAAGCPPFTSPTRTLPVDEVRRYVLPEKVCVDKESREQKKALPLPPRCSEGETPVHRHGRWRCVGKR